MLNLVSAKLINIKSVQICSIVGDTMLEADTLVSMVLGVVLALLQLLISLSLATATVYLAIRLFDKTTKEINEMQEIKKGNVAVAILLAFVVLSVASVVQVGVENLTYLITPSQSLNVMMAGMLVGVVQLLIGIGVAIFAVNLAIRVFDTVAVDIDLLKELKKGNVAVAILLSGVLLAISFVIRAGVSGLASSVDPLALVGLMG